MGSGSPGARGAGEPAVTTPSCYLPPAAERARYDEIPRGVIEMREDAFRPGDIVEVRSAAEILATLDAQGSLAELPFMPEMVQYCGGRFVVQQRAEKVCDTVHYSGSRRLADTVLLGDLRCDGSAHDGCQAECRLFWKESWLRRAGTAAPPSTRDAEALRSLVALTTRNAKQTTEIYQRPVVRYRCQATQLPQASEHLRTWDPRPYVREYTSGNVPLARFLRVTARAAVEEPVRKLGLMPEVALPGSASAPVHEEPLGLRPGEWVQVKTKEEIAETLTRKGKHRGLWFDREMIPHCGKTYRVRQRVDRFIDDSTGRMIELKNDCVTLEGVVCSGDLSFARWFCPRAIHPYWRECWLRRVDVAPTVSGR